MERRRLWWPVAGGPSTDTWERGYFLAIPSTRENHRFFLVVICDKRRGCTVIGVGRITPIKMCVLCHRGFGVILTGMAQGSKLMVSKPVGVRTAWCVGVGTQDDPEDATWHAVFKVRGCIPTAMVDDKSQRRYNSTQSKGREGKWLPGNLNL